MINTLILYLNYISIEKIIPFVQRTWSSSKKSSCFFQSLEKEANWKIGKSSLVYSDLWENWLVIERIRFRSQVFRFSGSQFKKSYEIPLNIWRWNWDLGRNWRVRLSLIISSATLHNPEKEVICHRLRSWRLSYGILLVTTLTMGDCDSVGIVAFVTTHEISTPVTVAPAVKARAKSMVEEATWTTESKSFVLTRAKFIRSWQL